MKCHIHSPMTNTRISPTIGSIFLYFIPLEYHLPTALFLYFIFYFYFGFAEQPFWIARCGICINIYRCVSPFRNYRRFLFFIKRIFYSQRQSTNLTLLDSNFSFLPAHPALTRNALPYLVLARAVDSPKKCRRLPYLLPPQWALVMTAPL